MNDLFGYKIPEHSLVQPEKPERKPSLRQRILDHYKANRFSTFSTSEIMEIFCDDKKESVLRTIENLKKNGYLVATGLSRGEGMHALCLRLNPGKR